MKAPKFWQTKNLISLAFWPLSLLYIFASFLRSLVIKPTKITTPIICIGNFTVGGAGKTPIALALGKILQEMKIDFAYLGHGYKAKNKDLTIIDKSNIEAEKSGDEALLLSEIAPVFIAKNRLIAAKEIAKISQKKLIIMDDGLQNPSLKKDFKIVVIDGEYGFGNNMILPSGPLRVNPNKAAKYIDLAIIIGEDKFNLSSIFGAQKVIFAQAKIATKIDIKSNKFIAFCGIGRPEKFFNILKKSDFNLIEEISFSDHYSYENNDLEKLIKMAKSRSANLVTTKKDWVKFSKEYQNLIQFIDIEVEFKDDDKEYIVEKIKKMINAN